MLLSTKEFALRAGFAPGSIRRFIREGLLKAQKAGGHDYVIDARQLKKVPARRRKDKPEHDERRPA